MRSALICSTLSVASCQTIDDVSHQMEGFLVLLTGQKQAEGPVDQSPQVSGFSPAPNNPGKLTGRLIANDIHSGDSFTLEGIKIALFGIDALESMQSCSKGHETIACGEIARNALIGFTAGEPITCLPDYFVSSATTWVSQCAIRNFSLSLAMVKVGLATTSVDQNQILTDWQETARQEKRGMWGMGAETPATWRSMHPTAVFSPGGS
jgi:endonuclease YncB( thermonuclease family)